MGKFKIFHRSELRVPEIAYTRSASGQVTIAAEAIPPTDTIVRFSRTAGYRQTWDFARWYGLGIDQITYAFQRQIERFLAKQDTAVEAASVAAYCEGGSKHFLNYCARQTRELRCALGLSDIDRHLIDGYLGYLGYLRDLGVSTGSQRSYYNHVKAVLSALGRRRLVRIVPNGDDATFPANPYPSVNRKYKSEIPLPRAQRRAFSAAVKTAVMPLLHTDHEPTSDTLAYALLVVALHTGANTTPLLELTPGCLRAHPKEATEFLTLYKRRGHTTSKIALRAATDSRGLKSVRSVQPTVARLIRRVIEMTEPLRAEARPELRHRVWLYRQRRGGTIGQVGSVNPNDLKYAIKKLVSHYQLTDANGAPLRINISRLRKTFANRIFELTGGDLAATAAALGNTPRVAGRHYLSPNEDAPRKWRFMGQCMVEELLSNNLGATARTPIGRCTDPAHGQYAPHKPGATCFQFLNCLRCRNYVVTGDDLYRLFSFKMRVLAERNRMPKRRWQREYAHIPRLIERDVVAEGLRRRVFSPTQVDEARERARIDPHPLWRDAIPSLVNLWLL